MTHDRITVPDKRVKRVAERILVEDRAAELACSVAAIEIPIGCCDGVESLVREGTSHEGDVRGHQGIRKADPDPSSTGTKNPFTRAPRARRAIVRAPLRSA